MSQLKFRFNFPKALQASGLILKLAGGEMNYLLFLKLLYMVERRYLAEEGDMITGDRVVAMPHGPVLSCVYNLIKGTDSLSAEWEQYIKRSRNYRIRLVNDPETPDLYAIEKDIIRSVFEEFGNKDQFLVRDMTHEFPEWAENFDGNSPRKSFPIPPEDILRHQNKEDMIAVAVEYQQTKAHYNTLFGFQQ